MPAPMSGEQFEDAVRREAIGALLNVLERGVMLGRYQGIPSDLVERVRALRTRVLEADVYELLYDALPPHTVDPGWSGDPFERSCECYECRATVVGAP